MAQGGKQAGSFGKVAFARLCVCTGLLFSLGAPVGAPALDSPEASSATANVQQLREFSKLTLDDNALVLSTGKSAQERNAEIPKSSLPIAPMGAFRTIGLSTPGYDQALTCLTQAIYYEAANEPEAGKRAVAQVVLNRVRHPAYPSSVCGVVYEGWDKPVCQFTFVCDGSLRRVPMATKWREARDIARAALAGRVEASVGTATHYHADYVLPRWAYTLAKVEQIGHHLFYRFPGRGGRVASFSARWSGVERIPAIDPARFAADTADLDGLAHAAAASDPLAKLDPTDRRADNDVGGRLDPSKQWRLTIPDPVEVSAAYNASRRAQDAGEPVL